MTHPEPLVFYFDFVSPYAFIAWTQVHAIAERNGRDVKPVPVLFAGLLDAHGTKGPAEVPAKRAYTFRDAYRKAHRLGLPALRPPPSHPFNPLLGLRVASAPLDRGAKRRLIDSLYEATWVLGTGIETPEAVAAAATRAGLDGSALVRDAQLPEAKQRLRDATDDAVTHGVFGVPTVLVDGEIFWGTDGLELVESFVRGADPVPKDLSWAERPASAMRRAVRT
ncbi:MAG: 2-hydroxychromene-2-carboxylate isomerase [Polyangiales bacterium]